jgi:hypothetical protein
MPSRAVSSSAIILTSPHRMFSALVRFSLYVNVFSCNYLDLLHSAAVVAVRDVNAVRNAASVAWGSSRTYVAH